MESESSHNQTYYHCASTLLEAGSVILPGNWWRTMKYYVQSNLNANLFNMYREEVFERVRKQSFPNKPSRLNSVFLCRNLNESNYYKSYNHKYTDIIYEVEIIDKNVKIHMADWNQVNPVYESPLDFIIPAVELCATNYWSGGILNPTSLSVEILTDSPVRIIRQAT